MRLLLLEHACNFRQERVEDFCAITWTVVPHRWPFVLFDAPRED